MLSKLLELLQEGNTYSVQGLAELMNEDSENILRKLEYLEKQGYIRKVTLTGSCNHHCIGCHGCDSVSSNMIMWEVGKEQKG